jgi:hypothetical protein
MRWVRFATYRKNVNQRLGLSKPSQAMTHKHDIVENPLYSDATSLNQIGQGSESVETYVNAEPSVLHLIAWISVPYIHTPAIHP